MTDADHWFEAGRRSSRFGIPAVLLHEGHRRTRSSSSSTALGLGPAIACSTSVAAPGVMRTSSARLGLTRARRRHLAAIRRPGDRPTRPTGVDVRTHGRARRLVRREFDAAISLCQGAFGSLGAGPGTERRLSIVDPDGEVLRGWPAPVGPAAPSRSRRSRPTSGALPRGARRLRRGHRGEPRAHHGAVRGRRRARRRAVDELLHAPGAAVARRPVRARGRARSGR